MSAHQGEKAVRKSSYIHPRREPLHLITHHLPIAVTFAFFSYESSVVIDPTHHEEAVIGERMTATLNSNGDVCAIQKAGREHICWWRYHSEYCTSFCILPI